MIQNTRHRGLVQFFILSGFLIYLSSICGVARASSGRLIVRLDGSLAGPIPPTLTLSGPGSEESRPLDAFALASREFLFEGLEPGVYHLSLTGTGGPTAGKEPAAEVGVHEGHTVVVHADIGTGRLAVDPFRPDPFGVDDSWDAKWIDALPGAGEEAPLAAETSPAEPRQTSLDQIDLVGTGFRHTSLVRGGSMARSLRSPIGIVPASEEKAARQILSRFDPSYWEMEGAAGDRGRNSYEGSLARLFPKLPWTPRLLISLRGLDYSDAAPSTFSGNEKLPHNDLKGFDLFSRVDARPAGGTRLTGLLYGEGTQRNHYVQAYRYDTSHIPRVDRASIEGGLRAVHQTGSRIRLLGEIDLQRTYMATGDGVYFDNVLGYERGGNPGEDESGVYWVGDRVADGNKIEGHLYNYFRKNVEVDWRYRLEAWRDPGSSRSIGAGILVRRGTYRSYENLDPVGGTEKVQAIGYDEFGEAHSEAAEREPGHPSTLAMFGTIRHGVPGLGGEVEAGLRLTRFSSGQEPLRDLSAPFGGDESFNTLALADPVSHTSLDPRIAYTISLGPRTRIWLSGGGETRIPPSEAIYYSAQFLKSTALTAGSGDDVGTILGNPGLKPERVMDCTAAFGLRMGPRLSLRIGAEGQRTADAFTPRAFPYEGGALAFYVNEGTRDLIDLFTRAEWEPSPHLSARFSYDLSRARTQTVEPELLDAAWYDPNTPPRFLGQQEGMVPVVPALQTGEAGSFYPSVHDRRHRVSVAFVARPAADLFGESGRIFLDHVEASALLRASSGGRFSWTTIYAAGLIPPGDLPTVLADQKRNDGALPWTGQLDLRLAKALQFPNGELQLWIEVVNVTDRRNTIRVYQATGKGDYDGALGTRLTEPMSDQAGFASAYSDRIQDPANYGEPRLLRAGLRLCLP